jgi:hemoglobin
MRMRHMPFKIGTAERDAWLVRMSHAMEQVPEFSAHRDVLGRFFAEFATFLINQAESS